MSIKGFVITCLQQNKGSFVSGAELSSRFNVSRSAVSKAVKELRREGYEIEAVTNRGYRLAPDCDIISREAIEGFLNVAGLNIRVVDTVESTNSMLKKAALDGEADKTVLLARAQTGGRGRMGRKFFSPEGTGIYMSILLRPSLSAEESLYLTTAAAVATARAIENVCGVPAEIKWVNDIFVGGKKVCGILTEASVDIETGGLQFAVVGIGVNAEEPRGGFPQEIKDIAAALGDNIGIKNRLAAEILNEFFCIYGSIKNGDYYSEYRSRLFILGKRVEVIKPSGVMEAVARDIGRDFRLLAEYDDGSREWLSSGEVRIKAV